MAYQVRGFAFDDELLLLQVLWGRQTCQYGLPKEKGVRSVQCKECRGGWDNVDSRK